MGWLEEFKNDVLRRSAYLPVEDDNLILVSHKTVDRLVAIAEEADMIMKSTLEEKQSIHAWVELSEMLYSDEWKP